MGQYRSARSSLSQLSRMNIDDPVLMGILRMQEGRHLLSRSAWDQAHREFEEVVGSLANDSRQPLAVTACLMRAHTALRSNNLRPAAFHLDRALTRFESLSELDQLGSTALIARLKCALLGRRFALDHLSQASEKARRLGRPHDVFECRLIRSELCVPPDRLDRRKDLIVSLTSDATYLMSDLRSTRRIGHLAAEWGVE